MVKTFEEVELLLSLEPGYASARREPGRVAALERRLGIACPRSIREWYERDDATSVLATYSNTDHPLDLAHMEVVGDRIVFMIENQGYADNVTFFTNVSFDRPGAYSVLILINGKQVGEKHIFIHHVPQQPPAASSVNSESWRRPNVCTITTRIYSSSMRISSRRSR